MKRQLHGTRQADPKWHRPARRLAAGVAAGAVALLALTACGQGGSPSDAESGGAAPEYQVDDSFKLDDSPTWKAAKQAGKFKVGVKYDQPGVGNMAAGASTPEGFDIEIAKMVLAKMGFAADDIQFVETVSANREPFLQNKNVNMVVATYTINDERKKVIDFAGPYYVAGQDVLVPNDSDITEPKQMEGKKVCSVNGSNSAVQAKEKFPKIELVTYDTYSKCMTDLESGSVEAVTTDDVILRGYAKQYDNKFKVLGKPFTDEPYGLGLPKGDKALRKAVNEALVKSEESGDWKKAFEHTLGDASQVTIPTPQP